MENIKTAEVKEANVKIDEAAHAEKVKLLDRVKESRPVRFVRKHRIGVAAGVGTALAAGAAVVMAARNGYVDVDAPIEAVGDAVTDAVETVTDTVA